MAGVGWGQQEWGAPLEYLERGYAVASIITGSVNDGHLPRLQIEDCKAAVRWLRANASEYRLDPNRFAAIGSSAGGHLAAMLGTTGDVREFEVGENLGVQPRAGCGGQLRSRISSDGRHPVCPMEWSMTPGLAESNSSRSDSGQQGEGVEANPIPT